MDREVLEAASVAWASLSALAVLLLGIASFAGRRTRPPGSVAFGAFAICWAAHVLMGQRMPYASAALAPQAHLIYLAFALPLPYFLVQLARAFAQEGAQGRIWRMLTAISVALPIAAIAALIVRPTLVYDGAVDVFGSMYPAWGPLYPWLVIAPFFLAQGLVLWTLDGARRASPTARPARRHALLAAGFAVFVAFAAGNNLAFYATELALGQGLAGALVYAALFAALSALALVVAARALRDAAATASAKLRASALIVAAAVLIPFFWGVGEGIVAWAWLPRFNSIGLWRLAGIGLIAFALAASRIPELEPRSRHTLATAIGILAAAIAGGLAIGALMLFAPGAPMIMLAATAIPLAALSPSVRLARRALRVTPRPGASDATLARRVDTYRAALESALARKAIAEDEPFLAALREDLGITADVHEALLVIARENVLPAPHATHPGYERLRLLGEGAHGRAWLARRRADDELVVLKEPPENDATAREALERQMRIALRVRHPRLVRIQELVDGPRGPFLVMDHMAGGSLAQRLERGPLAADEATRVAIDVLDGLAALHDADVAHGDVKAGNVLLDAEGRASVADFGLARATNAHVTLTLVGAQGTLAAMAPEQLAGAPASRASDLYAVGALLYRLLTGEHYLAFAGLDEARARSLVLEGAPRLPHARIPPGLEPIVRAALAKKPEDRFASARDMAAALRAGSGL